MLPTNIYTFTIGPSSVYQLQVAGDLFKILSSTGSLKVRADKDILISGMGAGQGVQNVHFERLELTNETGSNNTVRILIGDPDFIDGLIGSVSVTSNQTPQVTSLTNVNATVTNASASLLAANAVRKYLLIQNKDPSGSIYVNFGAAATVANGVLIGPGGSYEPSVIPTQQIFAIGSLANNPNVLTVEG